MAPMRRPLLSHICSALRLACPAIVSRPPAPLYPAPPMKIAVQPAVISHAWLWLALLAPGLTGAAKSLCTREAHCTTAALQCSECQAPCHVGAAMTDRPSAGSRPADATAPLALVAMLALGPLEHPESVATSEALSVQSTAAGQRRQRPLKLNMLGLGLGRPGRVEGLRLRCLRC